MTTSPDRFSKDVPNSAPNGGEQDPSKRRFLCGLGAALISVPAFVVTSCERAGFGGDSVDPGKQYQDNLDSSEEGRQATVEGGVQALDIDEQIKLAQDNIAYYAPGQATSDPDKHAFYTKMEKDFQADKARGDKFVLSLHIGSDRVKRGDTINIEVDGLGSKEATVQSVKKKEMQNKYDANATDVSYQVVVQFWDKEGDTEVSYEAMLTGLAYVPVGGTGKGEKAAVLLEGQDYKHGREVQDTTGVDTTSKGPKLTRETRRIDGTW